MSLPVFKVLSWEMLQAAIARLGGIDAIRLVHVLMPPLLAACVPLAYARLLRRLVPDRWSVALVLVMAQLFFVGDGVTSYGDFAFLRMHQGKALLLHIGLPLLTSYALDFAAAPSPRRWIRLAAANVCAVGLSSSGLWLAPACTGLALAAATPIRDITAWRGRRGPLATLGIGMAACVHPLALALVLRNETARAFRDALHRIDSLDWSSTRLMEHAQLSTLGDGAAEAIGLFALVAIGLCTASPLLRRYAGFTAFAFFLLFWNPFTANTVANQIAGPDTYFRVFWLVPLPVFVACLLSEPLAIPALRGVRVRGPATAAVAIAGVALLSISAGFPTLSSRNGVRLGAPVSKIPLDELAMARTIAAHAAPGELVVAPPRIARWIPLLHDHPSPLMVREMYLDLLRQQLGAETLDERKKLSFLVGGRTRLEMRGGDLLARAIEGYPLEVVCLGGAATGWSELRGALLESSLEVVARSPDFVVWARPPGSANSR
jgi:hypothetical protein